MKSQEELPTGEQHPRSLLRDRAYDHIHSRIVDGTFTPGSFLSEREMARTLEMSKTPIRVAFERLAEQGLVTISPQRGVYVRSMSGPEISDHYELRIALETFVMARLGEVGLTPSQRDQLEANLDHQDETVAGEVDIQAFYRADGEFHMLLASALGNSEIIKVMRYQRERLRRVIETIFNRDPRVPAISVQEHRAIYEALQAGDGTLAAAAVETHLANGRRFLLLGGTYGKPS